VKEPLQNTGPEGGVPRIGIVWYQFGPYHIARARAFRKEARGVFQVVAMELGNRTEVYHWQRQETELFDLIAICPGAVAEELGFMGLFLAARRVFAANGLKAILLPGYWPKQALVVLLAAKSLGIPAVMMNESHAGTARSGGFVLWIKSRLLRSFEAGLVGGTPQKRHFAALGMPAEKIFTGYDAVDNEYFSMRADEARGDSPSVRAKMGLPGSYFLSLGRLVEKKNLQTLVQAYGLFLAAFPKSDTHLVIVGSGEKEQSLRSLCGQLGLAIVEHGGAEPQPSRNECAAAVHFYGFRQIDENPAFYALADAFILPSVVEEWGLVVNEAMACGVPVVVSERAGCAEDLLESGWPELPASEKSEITDSLEKTRLANRIRRSGFVFDPGSPDELARILGQLKSSGPLRQAMGGAARKIVEKFSCANFGKNAIRAAKTAMGEVMGQ
jgi:glycosyltransferase involved in cell wall biosynthesis